MRTMYDSITAADIPRTAALVAGYVDGIHTWGASDWKLFPAAVWVPISALGSDRGTVGDVEPGCIWPPDAAPAWVVRRRAAGVDPTIYCAFNTWDALKAAFAAAGVAEPHWWIALWDNGGALLAGAVAKQYTHPPDSGGHYDLSVVADYWPGVDSVHGPGGGTLQEVLPLNELDAKVLIWRVAVLHGDVTFDQVPADIQPYLAQGGDISLPKVKAEIDTLATDTQYLRSVVDQLERQIGVLAAAIGAISVKLGA